MAIYTVNRVVKTLSIHKDNCNKISWDHLKSCGCGDTGDRDNQRWYCEDHSATDDVDRFMGGKFWAFLLCEICFREG